MTPRCGGLVFLFSCHVHVVANRVLLSLRYTTTLAIAIAILGTDTNTEIESHDGYDG